ncbi:Arginine--tRNA ligase [Bienertia sinuspersici]
MIHRLTDPYSYHESPEFDLDSATQFPETFYASDLPKFKPIDDPRFHLKGFRATINHLRYLGLESFDKVYHIGIAIENNLLKESNKNDKDGVPTSYVNTIEANQQRPKRKHRQYTPLGMSQEQAFDYLTAEGVLEPIGLTPDPVPTRTKWWNPNNYCQLMPLIITSPDHNQVNGIGDDKETTAQDEPMIRLLSKIVEAFESFNLRMTILKLTVQDNLDDNRKMAIETVHASWDDIHSSFDRLKSKGALSPIGPTGDPAAKRKSPRWDPNKYRKYHQGKGHDTEECWTLKNKLQDMLNDGRFYRILTVNKED